MTGLSCLLAGLTVPLVAAGIDETFGRQLDLPLLQIRIPMASMIAQLLPMLTLPVAFGMWVRGRWPHLAARYRPAIHRVAFAGVGLVLVLIIGDDPPAFFHGLSSTVPVAVVFVACSAAVGWTAGAMVSGDPGDRFTLAAEFGTRNLGVAMAIAVTMLGRVEFARFAYTYFLSEIPLMLMMIAWRRRRQEGGGAAPGFLTAVVARVSRVRPWAE